MNVGPYSLVTDSLSLSLSNLTLRTTHLLFSTNTPLNPSMSSSLPLQFPPKFPSGSHKTQSPSTSITPVSNLHSTHRHYSLMLQSSTSNGSLLDGTSIHARLIRTGIDPDTHLFDCLINHYAKCRSVRYAHRVFDEMPSRDMVAYTALITGYVLVNNGEEGIKLFCEMQEEGIQPNGFSLVACLRACSSCSDFDFGQQVQAEAIKMQALSDLFVGSSLVDLYVKCGEPELAEKVFFSLPQHNVVSLNALLNGYAQMGDEMKVLKVFRELLLESEVMQLNQYTLSIVVKNCIALGDKRYGRIVHSLVIKIGLELDRVLGSNLVVFYSKFGMVWDAYNIFVMIKDPDVILWSSMISCFNQQGFGIEALELFRAMGEMSIRPNQYTLASIGSVGSQLGDLKFCRSVHSCIIKGGFAKLNTVRNAILDMYIKCEAFRDGFKVFDAMADRDRISWNTLLSGFHSGEHCDEGMRIFARMLSENHIPNQYTFISVLRSCTSSMEADYGALVHTHVIKNNLQDDCFVGKALVDMYANCGYLSNAFHIFDRLRDKDIFTWSLLISGFTKKDEGEKAMECYRQMQQEGVNPNEFTLSSCLRACSNLTALESGSQLHSYAIKSGLSNLCVTSSLVDMYFKCGCLKEAEAVFDSSDTRDVVSWNTIVCGYSQYGYGKKALSAFQCILDEGMWPDEVTFIGVLSACSHEGLIEEGKQLFDSMIHLYEITPRIEHYASMVDLLCRGGKLDEAENFIDRMDIPPNALIWQIVLGACRMYGNLELGERAAEKLFELEPHTDSHYILLSNIYAAFGRWSDVARVRGMMSNCGIKKEPGCSWIQVDSQVHVFLAGDESHLIDKERFPKSKRLTHNISEEGYTQTV